MSRIVIADGSFLDSATLSAGSEVATMPVANLKTMQPGEKWRTTNLGQAFFDVDLGQDRAINLIGLLYTNASSTALYRVTAGTFEYFDLSHATYDSSLLDFSSETVNATGLMLSATGHRMYLVDSTAGIVIQYGLSTLDDISTAVADGETFSFAAQDSQPLNVVWKADGTKLYMLGQQNDAIYSYTAGVAWSVVSLVYDGLSVSLGSQDTLPIGFAFSADGTALFVVGTTNNRVYQYALSSAWNVSTATYSSVFLAIGAQDNFPQSLAFNGDGTRMFIVGNENTRVWQYSLSSGWDLSTAAYAGISLSIAAQVSDVRGGAFSASGESFYVIDATGSTIYQYAVGVTTASYDSGWLAIHRAGYPSDLSYIHQVLWLGETGGVGAQTYRFWRIDIDDANNPAGYFEMGRLYLANAWQPAINIGYGWGVGFIDESSDKTAIGGQSNVLERRQRRVINLPLSYQSEAEIYGRAYEIYRTRGRKKDVLIVRDPAATAYFPAQTVYGRFQDMVPIVNGAFRQYETRFTVEELLP